MAHITKYGEVISSALSPNGFDSAQNDLYQQFSIHIGEIISVYTADNSYNTLDDSEGIFTLYDVKITRPDGGSDVIYRCRALQPVFGGGINNYMEVVPTIPDQESSMSGSKSNQKDKSEKRGHQVVLGFLGGYKGAGIILGGIPHTSPISKKTRPTKKEGVITRLEIQGTMVEINNDGEFTLKFNGPKNDKGKIANTSVGPTIVKINKEGVLSLTTKEKEQTVVMSPADKKIEITNGKTKISTDGSVVSIVGDVVETGKGTLEPHLCGDTWKKIMEELIDEISQIIVPTGVGPSGVPQNAAKFSTIKQKLKNALSTKHTVER